MKTGSLANVSVKYSELNQTIQTNDRKTPYTEEEIDAFVEDYILGLDDQE